FARFQGDVAERAEEFQVFIDGSGRVFRVNHDLPEARPGKSLAQEEARKIATDTLQVRLGPHAASLQEISAEAGKRPARTDWTFVFKVTQNYGLPEGDPSLAIEIGGAEVVDFVRFIYVPVVWLRPRRMPWLFYGRTLRPACLLDSRSLGLARWQGTWYRR